MLKPGDKVLFISQYAGFIGGLERYIHAAASLLRRQGLKPYSIFVERTRNADAFLEVFEKHWSADELDAVDETFDFSTLHKIANPVLLEKFIARFSPTVFVHDHDYYCPKGYKYLPYRRKNCTFPFGRAWCTACSLCVPPRKVEEGYPALLRRTLMTAPRLLSALKKAPSFVVLSDFMRGCLELNGIPRQKINVLHPFIDTPAQSGMPTGDVPLIVFIGQQVMSKGTPLFLEAVKQMKQPCRAVVLGAGIRLADFTKLSVDMGLGDRVEFLGWVDEPKRYLASAYAAVFPSLWQEPFGLSGPEAMALEVPVVGFDVGGVGEWLKDDVNGVLVPERDTAAMARALDRLIEDRPLRDRLGVQGRAYVLKNYSEAAYFKNFCSLK